MCQGKRAGRNNYASEGRLSRHCQKCKNSFCPFLLVDRISNTQKGVPPNRRHPESSAAFDRCRFYSPRNRDLFLVNTSPILHGFKQCINDNKEIL